MMQRCLVACAALALATVAGAQTTIFSEDWDDGLGADRWSDPLIQLETETLSFDGSVDYNFDYSVIASSAPNSAGGSTTGIYMETNTTDDGDVDEGESVGVIPNGFTLPAGDFTFSADLYLFWNGGSGSTEYSIFGVHHQGSDQVSNRFAGNNGDGLSYQVDTDGDSGTDLLRFENDGVINSNSGLAPPFGPGWEDIPNGTIPGVPTGATSPIGIANQWVDMEITATGDTIEFKINGVVLDTYANNADGGFFSGGTILIGQSDPFNSTNLDNPQGLSNAAIWDNIVVTTPGGGGDPNPGDFNADGTVDNGDLNLLLNNWGELAAAVDPLWVNNLNGTVDNDELNALLNNWGFGISAVPEPTTALLLLAGLAMRSRRR
ncbi:MAG: PEP-CTERM sorting domain-containing protein [Planctomycetota bacterium]